MKNKPRELILNKTIIGLFLFFILSSSILSSSIVFAVECGSNPIDNCFFSVGTILNATTHPVSDMVIIADNIAVDCNGARLLSSGGNGIIVGERINITIKNCYFEGYAAAITTQININDESFLANSTILNNSFYSNNYAIRLVYVLGTDFLNFSGRNKIINNILNLSHFDGIVLSSSNKNLIEGNTMNLGSHFQASGVKIENSHHNVIRYNKITNFPKTGVRIQSGSNHTIQGNELINNEYGIELMSGNSNAIVKDNLISENNNGKRLWNFNV